MSGYQSEALTLRTYPYAESHKIAVFLTRNFGKVRGVAYGAQKAKGRFSGALEPLTHLRLTFSRKENQELASLNNCEILQVFPGYQLSLEVNLHFSYFAELLVEFSREEEESELLFRLSLAVLEATQKISIDRVARYFELWLLKLEGVLPSLEAKLPPTLAEKVYAMMKIPAAELETVQLSGEENRRLESLSGQLIECHLEKRLKTKKMLKELL
ncbi:MAG: DNA repair protein RecO [Acidobacteria bacterium]|nr:MAG: DNA repair protein RecO [Acidobacteriota bacterium]